MVYLTVPVVYSDEGSITTPFWTVLDMSKAASIMVHDMNTEASAKCIPKLKVY